MSVDATIPCIAIKKEFVSRTKNDVGEKSAGADRDKIGARARFRSAAALAREFTVSGRFEDVKARCEASRTVSHFDYRGGKAGDGYREGQTTLTLGRIVRSTAPQFAG